MTICRAGEGGKRHEIVSLFVTIPCKSIVNAHLDASGRIMAVGLFGGQGIRLVLPARSLTLKHEELSVILIINTINYIVIGIKPFDYLKDAGHRYTPVDRRIFPEQLNVIWIS